MEYVFILQQAMVWVITIYWVYQLVISLCSLIKVKEKPFVEDKEHRFMMIIPAHNEEKVVRDLVESLKNLDYRKDLYDIYVIADNCTDNTAQIAKEAGAIYMKDLMKNTKQKDLHFNGFYNKKLMKMHLMMLFVYLTQTTLLTKTS